MAKKKKLTSPRKKAAAVAAGPRNKARLKWAIHLGCALVLVGLLSFGYWRLRNYVARDIAFSAEPPKIILANRPVWMSDYLAETIAKSARPVVGSSALDHQLLVDAVNLLQHNPWVKNVRQVRRIYGRAPGDTLLVDCDYRTPAALVKNWDGKFILVDQEYTVLPEKFTAKELPRVILGHDGRTNIRIVEGVTRQSPQQGQVWQGDDLRAGVEMAQVLSAQPWADEIQRISVENYAGRKDPNEAQLVLITRNNTQVRWGRPPRDPGFEVSTIQKLENLRQVFAKYHRVDAGRPWIDVRFDQVAIPKVELAGEPGSTPTR